MKRAKYYIMEQSGEKAEKVFETTRKAEEEEFSISFARRSSKI